MLIYNNPLQTEKYFKKSLVNLSSIMVSENCISKILLQLMSWYTKPETNKPAGIYLFKVNYGNHRRI